MELKAFKEKNRKKIGIIVFTVTCILLISGVILYRTFAIFETNDNFNVINGKVEDMGDVQFVFYIDDEISKKAPKDKEKYSLDTTKSHCTNGALVYWNDTTERAEVDNLSDSKTKCYLYFKQIYKEEILNGAIPDLGNGRLIPVTISDNEKPSDVMNYTNSSNTYGGKVTKANITTDWYSYEQKRWANAIILKDGEVDHYKPGEEIQESAIESYFVWIPRYKYQLKESESVYNGYTEVNPVGEISDNSSLTNIGETSVYEIIFETKNDGTSTGSTQGQWLTHPAFTSFNSNGMWVGKFETGYAGTTNTAGAQINSQESDKIIIKPNVYSWREIQVGNAFYASYNYIRELESHMMKNTEWGAIFYLTQSQYGLCRNGNCTELRMNNNGNYATGYSASKDSTCGHTGNNIDCNIYEETVDLNVDGQNGYTYYNSNSQAASTTGNYYGIYDMSGSAWEYVMGVMQSSSTNANPASGPNSTTNSGFKGPYSNTSGANETGLEWPSSKYYDLYDYDTTNQHYQRGHLGDATKELGLFYSVQYNYNTKLTRYVSSYNADGSFFVNSVYPWFGRGGDFANGSETGVGAFSNANGYATFNRSFRLVLMP